jgi:alkanesulfonate monooxygenase SsuD/methylene tetrahydromethanopterin reductase-like flavin-dependent oxidoreductase (luciferase family)
MVAMVGEVADGLMAHPTNTAPRYLREVILPRLALGAGRVAREPSSVELMIGPLIVTGPDAETLAREREKTRQMLTFLYSTPSYWPSLEIFGWQDRGEKLHQLTREGRWGDMEGIIDDEMLSTFAPTGSYDEIVDVLSDCYADISPWITFPMPEDPAHDPLVAKVIERLRSG